MVRLKWIVTPASSACCLSDWSMLPGAVPRRIT
jgi:hypothetical protein